MQTNIVKIGISTVFLIMLIFLGIGLIQSINENKIFDAEISIINEIAKTGEPLQIQINILNIKSKKNIEIQTVTKILHTDIVCEETFIINQDTSKQITLNIPEQLEKGHYILETTLNLKNKPPILNTIEFYINPANTTTNAMFVENKFKINKTITTNENKKNNTIKNTSISTQINPETQIIKNTTALSSFTEISISLTEKEIYNTAIKQNKTELCHSIQNSDLKNNCYMKISKQTVSKEICRYINDTYLKEACFVQVADVGDITACNEVSQRAFIRMCADIKVNS